MRKEHVLACIFYGVMYVDPEASHPFSAACEVIASGRGVESYTREGRVSFQGCGYGRAGRPDGHEKSAEA